MSASSNAASPTIPVDAIRTFEVARAATTAGYMRRRCSVSIEGCLDPLTVRRPGVGRLPRIDGVLAVVRRAGALVVTDHTGEPVGRIDRPPGIIAPPGMRLADIHGHEVARVVKLLQPPLALLFGAFATRPTWPFEVLSGDVQAGAVIVNATVHLPFSRGYTAFDGTIGIDRTATPWLDGRLALAALLLLVDGPGDWRGASVSAERARTRRAPV